MNMETLIRINNSLDQTEMDVAVSSESVGTYLRDDTTPYLTRLP